MKSIKVDLKTRAYDIVIGSRLLNKSGELIAGIPFVPPLKDAYIITYNSVKIRYGEILAGSLKRRGFGFKFKTVSDGEKSKSLDTAYSIIEDIINYDLNRRVFIIAFGGGVIGDVAGFVASIYKRGIPYIQVPTTLLAQVDSGIGGKTAVDLAAGKNLVGTFYQPSLVISDIALLNTLDMRQLRSGIAEVIKYGIISDRELFGYLEAKCGDILKKKKEAIEFIVGRSSSIKAMIIGQDETEKKTRRTVLNFGHTMGHAIESAGNYREYNHGEAISLGMLIAGDISRMLGLISDGELQRIENMIKAFGLPDRIKNIPIGSVIKAHYRDKKFSGGRNRFVVIERIGKTRIVENVPLTMIEQALKKRYP